MAETTNKKFLDKAGLTKVFELIAGKYATIDSLKAIQEQIGEWNVESMDTIAKAVAALQENGQLTPEQVEKIEDILDEYTNYVKRTELTDYVKKDEVSFTAKGTDKVTVKIGDKTQDVLTSHQSLEDYATTDYVDTELAEKADKSDIADMATKTWVNSEGFLKEHQSLAEYAKKTEVTAEIAEAVDGLASEEYVDSAISELNINDYVKKANVGITTDTAAGTATIQVDEGKSVTVLTKHQSLSDYYTKTEVDTELAKKADSSDLEGLASEDYVDSAIEDLSDTYVTKESVKFTPNTSAKTVEIKVDDKTATVLTEHQSLDNYYTKTEVDGKFTALNMEQYATKEEVNTGLASKLDSSTYNTDKATFATKTWVEEQEYLTEDDLADYAKTEDVNTELAKKADKTAAIGSARYDSESKKIVFTAVDGTTTIGNGVDCTDFIKDGMVDKVEVVGTDLVITFNTVGNDNKPTHEEIRLAINKIFDASNYYNKTEADNTFVKKADAKIEGSTITLGDNSIQFDSLSDGDIQAAFDGTVSSGN